MSRRVTFLVDSPTFGGAETTVAQLLRHLPADHVCTVVATEPVPPRLATAAAVRGSLISVPPVGRDPSQIGALAARVAATRPHVVHANLIDPGSNVVLVEAAAAVADSAAVASVHLTGDVGSGADHARLAAAFHRLDAVIAVSDDIRDLLVGALGVPRAAVHRVTNGVDPLPVVARPARQPLVVGGVGRLTAQKGFDVLLDATRLLFAGGVALEVVVVGDGRERPRLEAAATGLPVRFRGFSDTVADDLATVDVFCLPSRAEALPLALLEAMMTGLPCVATTVGQIPAAINGVVELVAPDDPHALAAALARLLRDPDRRQRLGRAAAALAHDRFDVRRAVAEVVDVYAAVAARASA